MRTRNEWESVWALENSSPAENENTADAAKSGRRISFKSQLLIGAASVIGAPAAATAQEAADPVPLPTLNVETTAKKKAAAKKKSAPKKAASSQQISPAPVAPQFVPPQQQADPLPGQAAPVAAGQYNAQYSTSAKTTGPLLNTPQTVDVIPTAIIQERKTTTLLETLKNTPGITIDAGENGFSSGGLQFNIRGFNSVGNIFVDGTRDNGAFPRDVFNVEQVEVFKGPAADNGRGSAGGYINIVTKTPKLEDFVHANVGIGFDEYDSEVRRRAAFDVNQSSGTVAARLNMFIQDGGVAGREVAEANAWGAAPSLAFGLGTDTRAIFSYEHVERRDLPDSGVAFNRGGASIHIPGAGPNTVASNGPRDRFFGAPTDYDDVNADAFSARFEHDLSDNVTISNQTRWAQVDREARYHVPGTAIPGSRQFYDRVNETITNQTNLAARFYTGQFKHTLSTGIEISHEESESLRFSSGVATQRANVKVDTLAGYLYDTIELNRNWQVVGGLRVENYDLEIDGAGIPGVATGRSSQNETTLGGKIGIIYKPVREGTFYASYGLSHLPPGSYLSNPDISRTGDGAFPGYVADADPVQMHNYELGVKWDFFNGKLSTTAALFRTEKHKVAYTGCTTVVSTNNPCQDAVAFKGYGEQMVQGIELGIAGNLTEHWKVYGGVLLMESERKHSAYLDLMRRNANPADYGTALRTSGDDLAYTPNFTATLWTTYDVTKELTIGGGVQYVGDSWIGRTDDALRVIANGRYGKVPDYFLVNLMASYDVTENIELSLNVDNVFDELYLTTANWNGNWGYVGPPRTYWLSASYKY